MTIINNPFKPGAGHMPPYLAGREEETAEFKKLLTQTTILENMVLTGLRGVGKTVLLETFKPLAQSIGWFWVGTDLSESASLNEANIAIRLLTDLSVITSSYKIGSSEIKSIGFLAKTEVVDHYLNYALLNNIYDNTPGLPSDKLKAVLEIVWKCMENNPPKGLILAYDEAQNLADHVEKDQFPLSLLLDVFQSIQRKGIPFFLLFTGLPTLFPKLVEARTYAERMFRVVFLDRLKPHEVKEAILKPIEKNSCGVMFSKESVETVIKVSGGYPYFIQFICREVYDVFIQKINANQNSSVPVNEIIAKLDTDFFSGRWARVTDRQRDLLAVIARLETCDSEFSVQEVVKLSKSICKKSFSSSHVNQMLSSLSHTGLVYKNRHGKYSFAVPLLDAFIRRQPIDGLLDITI